MINEEQKAPRKGFIFFSLKVFFSTSAETEIVRDEY